MTTTDETTTEPMPERELPYEHDNGVLELFPDDPLATVCGTCGRGWDDDHVSDITPTPSGRCPFEYEHPDEDERSRQRLEYLRGQLRGECISMGELHELQGLADLIAPDDVELLEAAGVPEFPDDVPDETPEDVIRNLVYDWVSDTSGADVPVAAIIAAATRQPTTN